MLFRQRKPRPPLSRFVEHLWFYRDLQVKHRREKLLPDAAMEFIIDLTDSPKKLFNGTTTEFRTYRNAWISGMHRRFIVIGAENKSSMIGAHFRTGGAAPFFRFPLSELAGDVVELDLIFKREILALRERILETDDIDTKFDLFEAYLISKAERLEPDRAVSAALAHLRSFPVMPLREVASTLGVTHKEMISRFDCRVGLTPKAMSRVMRFQRALQKAYVASGDPDWSDLALDCGYYDQAHLIHEFQAFAGATPGEYLRNRTEYPNYLYID
jgi:AraC-like DNA-binding protein